MHKIRLDEFLRQLVYEDIGRGDLFSRIMNTEVVEANIIAKSSGILSGELYVERLCELSSVETEFFCEDGKSFQMGSKIVTLKGKLCDVLILERSVLNLLEHSSGIATLTHRYVKMIEDSDCMLLDTRKTRPLLREFEKYSARNGGASNHRFGLDDCLMLKDTHLARILSLKKFIDEIRPKLPFTAKIEVECSNLLQVEEALDANVDILMCDNMSAEMVREAVELRNAISPKTLLEASGNITLSNIKEYAYSGADAISTGAIIHQATWIDMSMQIN
ncbi:MAG: carboxylating nicotinate-nucleotide diphosphorylase [Helicobacter sp.]|nr:carboxylating nicotinate-nucleotide diphosphorylase [Helicobacter sp.]